MQLLLSHDGLLIGDSRRGLTPRCDLAPPACWLRAAIAAMIALRDSIFIGVGEMQLLFSHDGLLIGDSRRGLTPRCELPPPACWLRAAIALRDSIFIGVGEMQLRLSHDGLLIGDSRRGLAPCGELPPPACWLRAARRRAIVAGASPS